MKNCPPLPARLPEFAAGVADGMNAAHNNALAYPAPNVLEGRQTGLVSSDILRGSGDAQIAVVTSDGVLVNSVDITVGAGGFTVNGVGAPQVFDLSSLSLTPPLQAMRRPASPMGG